MGLINVFINSFIYCNQMKRSINLDNYMEGRQKKKIMLGPYGPPSPLKYKLILYDWITSKRFSQGGIQNDPVHTNVQTRNQVTITCMNIKLYLFT